MTDKIFPELNEKNMHVVAQLYDDDPHYFEHINCPYSEEVINIFKAGNPSNDYFDAEDMEGMDISEFDEGRLIKEISILWGQLKSQGETMSKSETASERNTYFRMSTALLEKIVALRERCMNLKKMHDFTDAVLAVMEDKLDAEQRTAVMEELNKILEGD